MKLKLVAALAVAFGLGYATAAWLQPGGLPMAANAPIDPPAPAPMAAPVPAPAAMIAPAPAPVSAPSAAAAAAAVERQRDGEMAAADAADAMREPVSKPTPSKAQSAPQARLAQGDFGYRCATVGGICQLPVPQPIGSVCYCDGVEGTTVR